MSSSLPGNIQKNTVTLLFDSISCTVCLISAIDSDFQKQTRLFLYYFRMKLAAGPCLSSWRISGSSRHSLKTARSVHEGDISPKWHFNLIRWQIMKHLEWNVHTHILNVCFRMWISWSGGTQWRVSHWWSGFHYVWLVEKNIRSSSGSKYKEILKCGRFFQPALSSTFEMNGDTLKSGF